MAEPVQFLIQSSNVKGPAMLRRVAGDQISTRERPKQCPNTLVLQTPAKRRMAMPDSPLEQLPCKPWPRIAAFCTGELDKPMRKGM